MNINLKNKFAISKKELAELFRVESEVDSRLKIILWIIGAVLSPAALAGALIGYARAYQKFLKPEGYKPELAHLTPVVRASMLIFGSIGFIINVVFFYSLLQMVLHPFGSSSPVMFEIILVVVPFFLAEAFFINLAFSVFYRWQIGINNMLIESEKFGTARFAYSKELLPYTNKKGIYIGGGYTFSDKGHILTMAGTRGGKGTNLIIPSLLGVGGYKGSLIILDVKAENAIISTRYQRESGNNVVILNPWQLFADKIGHSQSYNPLDILTDKNSIHLVDDIAIISEMLLPIEKDEKDKFFVESGRAIVSGLLLYLMVSGERKEQTLTTLWKWVRLSGEKWNNLVADMAVYEDETNGETVRNAASEILKLMQTGDKTYGNIVATILQATDFLKSPALQQSLQSGFSPYELADGKTTVYVITPVDKLKSHSRWLRLIVTSTMRAVVRKPNKRVTYVLDEFAALGYISEITNALSTYAGYEISIWAIVQSLIQLKDMYSDNWETFIANCAIRQYFSVNDNFSADYISKAIGQASNVIVTKSWFGISNAKANPRALVTPDEVRRGSGKNIFAFFSELPPTVFPKFPYYHMSNLIENGTPRYDDNPYIKE